MKDQSLWVVWVLLIAGSAYAQTEPTPPAGPPPADGPPPAVTPAPPAPEAAPPPPAVAPAAPPPTPGGRTTAASVKIDTPSSSIKFGVLLQPQYEAIGSPALDSMS